MRKRTGVQRIAAERRRQIKLAGYDSDHDDVHDDGSIALAAACYAAPERVLVRRDFARGVSFTDPFPWPSMDKRPRVGNVVTPEKATIAQRIRLLEKAGALCAAEIDRLQRKLDRRGK